jgi:hypothetical protein
MKAHYNVTTKHKEDLFDSWTEKSAYVLGYLEADGYIIYDGPAVRVYFQCSDKDIGFLRMLRDITEFTGKIGISINRANNKEYKKARFTITSRAWNRSKSFQELRSNKIINIPEEMIHHYIRGYFDGDGSIYFSKQVNDYKSSFVFSSEELAVDFKNELELQGIKVSNIHQKTNSKHCWYFQLSYRQTELLGKFMYKDSNLYMNRKYQQFNQQQELLNNS